jgi:hypothetical protein
MNVRITVLGLLTAIALAAPTASAASPLPEWQRALAVRSEALNRTYHLGEFAVPRALTANTSSEWYRALEIRSRAMNERYRLGTFAPSSTANTFDWSAAGIGAAVSAAACIVLAAAMTTRTRLLTRAQRMP